MFQTILKSENAKKKNLLTRTVTGTFAFDNGTDTTRLGIAVDIVEADDDAAVEATLYTDNDCSRTSLADSLTSDDCTGV